MEPKNLIIIHSYHHKNTEKIAYAMAKELNATVQKVKDVKLKELENYDIIGFGSGIAFNTHYKPLIKLVEKLPTVNNKKAFIFSTSGMANNIMMKIHHKTVRNILIQKGYSLIGEYTCKGFDTFTFLKIFGGISKGHPNKKDLEKAKIFAKNLIQ